MPHRGHRFIAPVVAEDANAIAPSPIDATRDPAPGPRADAERWQITVMSCELIGAVGRADGVYAMSPELLDRVVERASDLRLLLIMTFAPNFSRPGPANRGWQRSC